MLISRFWWFHRGRGVCSLGERCGGSPGLSHSFFSRKGDVPACLVWEEGTECAEWGPLLSPRR